MKAFTGLILFATVVSFNTPVYAEGTAAAGSGDAVECDRAKLGKADYEDCKATQAKYGDNTDKTTCNNAVAEMAKTLSKAKSACRSAGLKLGDKKDGSKSTETAEDCMKKAEECHDILNAEPETESDSGNVINMLLQATGNSGLGGLSSLLNQPKEYDPSEIKGQCYGRDDFDKQLKQAKEELKESKDKIADFKKDMNDVKKDAEEARDQATKDMVEHEKAVRENKTEMMKGKQQAEADMAKAEMDTKTQVADLNLQIIQAQGQLSDAILARATALSQLTDAMINRKCAELVVGTDGKLKSANRVGSQNSLIRSASKAASNANQDFRQCQKENLLLREKTVAATQAQIDGLQSTINSRLDTVTDMNKGLTLAKSQKTQSDQQAATDEQKVDQENQITSQNLQQNLVNQNQVLSEKLQNLQGQLDEAEKMKNQASGRIALLGTEPAGEKSPQEAMEAVGDYEGARDACYAACGEEVKRESACAKLDIDKDKGTTASPTTTGSNTPTTTVTPAAGDTKPGQD